MTKKQTAIEATDTSALETSIPAPTVEASDRWTRQAAIEIALTFHKTNGGMLTVPQLIEHANQFHTFITGETK